jgi:hypothetical protein
MPTLREYGYLPLSEISQYESEMEALGVSEVARGRGGFLSAYKRAGGNPNRLSDAWRRKRHGFIKRHLAQYRANPTHRRRLALRAWAYEP